MTARDYYPVLLWHLSCQPVAAFWLPGFDGVIAVTAEGGRTFILKGLPIRWSLNVPDNLFVFEKSVDPDGVDRYTFYGKGWGHGVGLCQVGAFGMAQSGSTYEQILKHYYTGIALERAY